MVELIESIIHEKLHLLQEHGANMGWERSDGEPYVASKSGAHNKQWVAMAEECGLHPLPVLGAHYAPMSGQAERLASLLGYDMPDHAKGDFPKPENYKGGKSDAWWFSGDRGKPRGSSSLTKYEADKCLRPRTCVIRAGIKDLTLSCYTDGCGGVFRPVY